MDVGIGRRRRWNVAAAMVLVALLAGVGLADLSLEVTAPPTESHSWYQEFTLMDTGSGGHGFDRIVITMVAPIPGNLEDPFMTIGSGAPAGGVSISGTNNGVVGEGTDIAPPGTELVFDLHFAGGFYDQPIAFNLNTYESVDDDEPRGTAGAIWSAGKSGVWKWKTEHHAVVLDSNGDPVFVPMPAAIVLGMVGLTAAGLRLRKLM